MKTARGSVMFVDATDLTYTGTSGGYGVHARHKGKKAMRAEGATDAVQQIG